MMSYLKPGECVFVTAVTLQEAVGQYRLYRLRTAKREEEKGFPKNYVTVHAAAAHEHLNTARWSISSERSR